MSKTMQKWIGIVVGCLLCVVLVGTIAVVRRDQTKEMIPVVDEIGLTQEVIRLQAEYHDVMMRNLEKLSSDELEGAAENTTMIREALEYAESKLADEVDGELATLQDDWIIWVDATGEQHVFTFDERYVSYPRELSYVFSWVGYVDGDNQRYVIGSYNEYNGETYYNHHVHNSYEDYVETVRLVEIEGKACLVRRTYRYDENIDTENPRNPNERMYIDHATKIGYDSEWLVDNLVGESVRNLYEGDRIIHLGENYPTQEMLSRAERLFEYFDRTTASR